MHLSARCFYAGVSHQETFSTENDKFFSQIWRGDDYTHSVGFRVPMHQCHKKDHYKHVKWALICVTSNIQNRLS